MPRSMTRNSIRCKIKTMKKNLRKSLLVCSLIFLCGCAKNASKAITIDQGTSLIDTCLEKDRASALEGQAFTFKSTISAPSALLVDLPYTSLEVDYLNTIGYSTRITRVTSKSNDTYAITKSTGTDGKIFYQVAANGGSPKDYDPVSDAYLYNFFELPNYLLNENIYGLQSARNLLAFVQNKNENKLTSYNLFSSGGGNLDMTLRGNGLDFTSLFTETPQINSNVTSIHFVLDNYLLTSLNATYLVDNPTSSSVSGQIRPTSSTNGVECAITMSLAYRSINEAA